MVITVFLEQEKFLVSIDMDPVSVEIKGNYYLGCCCCFF